VRGPAKEMMILVAIAGELKSSSSSKIGRGSGKGRQLLVGKDNRLWTVRE
jgi:hypothetical protein